ncbi:hypothetical protein D932_00369 [Enterococcus casseliflavus 14-MB-W-14]|uniref:Uncharacterized protein n=1 Tax=Enterococcus casseliflavus ATCC 12755 TaxID=888066 RepID=F0EHL7_ENTCA|nr:hypothetical protein HMPREF9087_0909 [Enterococcus casseliflavus ATCC 12755]EPH65939.1 hypothetical protein D932_00369 [Enterococcus casseliflavus 14-MB-W-14]EPH66401.1 hypothetical protein D931_01140 [Enterococcus faecium 13.SD.W.09]EPH93916.1 hypothetical protein D922_01718 [Enterococcus faecalis 06-MB-DW-09]
MITPKTRRIKAPRKLGAFLFLFKKTFLKFKHIQLKKAALPSMIH